MWTPNDHQWFRIRCAIGLFIALNVIACVSNPLMYLGWFGIVVLVCVIDLYYS